MNDDTPPTPQERITFDETEAALPDAELYSRLAPFVQIGKATGRAVPTSQFSRLSIRQQVILAVLTRVAKDRLGVLSDDETRRCAPAAIARFANTPIGDVYPVIRQLEREEYLHREDGRYTVLPETVADAVELLPR